MAGGGCTTKVVQITNIAPQATKDQMQNLFGNIGKIEEIRLYPTIRDVSCPVYSRICYVKYFESSCVAVAQHMTNTVFIDRALIICAVPSGYIPDEYKALEITNNGTTVPGLHAADVNLPAEVVNRIDGIHPNQFVTTSDPKLEEFNLPPYPQLPANYDARKIEEIRRTIIVMDIQSDWQLDGLMQHFGRHGSEVKYARYAEANRSRYVMLELCEQKSIVIALKLQGTDYSGYPLNVYHSVHAIAKPEAKSNEAAQREIEEAMSIVKEAQSMISAAIDPVIGMLSNKEKSVSSRRRTRSRSPRRRSRSRSKRSKSRGSKRSKSRSKRSRSKRSRSKGRSRRSSSRSKKRSPSRSKRSSPVRKRSKSHSSRKRSKSRSKRSKSRSKRSKSIQKRPESRSKRSRSKSNRSKRSRSKDRRPRNSKRKSVSPRSPVARRRNSRSRSPRGGTAIAKRSRSRDRHHRSHRSSNKNGKDEKRTRTRSKSKVRESSRVKDKSSTTNKTSSSSSSRSSAKRRSRTPVVESKKSMSNNEDKVTRDYDAEEKIGADDALRPPEPTEKSTSPEKSDNMDISNSP